MWKLLVILVVIKCYVRIDILLKLSSLIFVFMVRFRQREIRQRFSSENQQKDFQNTTKIFLGTEVPILTFSLFSWNSWGFLCLIDRFNCLALPNKPILTDNS